MSIFLPGGRPFSIIELRIFLKKHHTHSHPIELKVECLNSLAKSTASRATSACASKSETSVCSACNYFRRRELRTFVPPGVGRFHSVNRRRNSFHRVTLATLEHAVLKSFDAGVYTLQIHAYPTRRAGRTFSPQQLRQSACAHGCIPRELHQRPNVNQKRCRRQLRCDHETGHLEHKIGNASK